MKKLYIVLAIFPVFSLNSAINSKYTNYLYKPYFAQKQALAVKSDQYVPISNNFIGKLYYYSKALQHIGQNGPCKVMRIVPVTFLALRGIVSGACTQQLSQKASFLWAPNLHQFYDSDYLINFMG